MKLLIDLQGAQTQSRHRGIGRYTRALAKACIAHAGAHDVHLAFNATLDEDGTDAAIAEFLPLLPRDRIHLLRLPYGTDEQRTAEGGWRRAAAARLMRHALEALQPDVVWHTSVFEGMNENAVVPDAPSPRHASVATLYDLIPLHEPALHLSSEAARAWYARRLAFLRRCDLLLAISGWTKQDAIERLALPDDRVAVVGGAVDRLFAPPAGPSVDAFADLGITRPFVLYSGGLDPRKNVATLVRAFARLPDALRARHQLVVVGSGTEEQRALARLGAKLGLPRDALLLPGYVPDRTLTALYGACALFVFPSRFEGLGLPPLEAMACGAPVVCSHATSLPEVVGRDDVLFDPDDVDQLRDRMVAVLDDPARAQVLRDAGLRRARTMTWDAVAQRAWAGFEAVHAARIASSRVACTVGHDEDLAEPTPSRDDASRALDEARLVDDLARLDEAPSEDDVAQVAFGIAATRRPDAPPRWLVDVSSIARHDLRTGIQQVVRNVLQCWFDAPPAGVQVTPVRFDAGHFRHARAYARQAFGLVAEGDDACVMPRSGDVFVGLDWAFEPLPAMRPRLADWRRGGVRSCVVVYDLLPVTLPQHFHPHARERFAQWLGDAVHIADRFACISRTTSDALSGWLEAHAARDQFGRRAPVEHFPLGADTTLPVTPDALRPSLAAALATRPTLLMVGTLEPRKAHAEGLDACEALWRRGVDANLVLAGRRGWMTDALVARLKRHPERDRRLFWHEDVGDAELHALYAGSTALLALSHGEGYGLPLVEAARHGLPVFARDLPVFREVLGDYPHYLDDTTEHRERTLAAWLASRPARQAPPVLPSWRDSADALADIVRRTAAD